MTRTRPAASHLTVCCGPVPAGDASEHLVHRLLLALAGPRGRTLDQIASYLGNVPPEALERRLADLTACGMATPGHGRAAARWALTDKGRQRAADLTRPKQRTRT